MMDVFGYSGEPARTLDLRQELIAAGFVIECWDDGTRLTMTRTLQRQGVGEVVRVLATEEGATRN